MADDAIINASSNKSPKDKIEVLKTSPRKYGLESNEQKSKVLHVRNGENQ